jgi:hypothetical protein
VDFFSPLSSGGNASRYLTFLKMAKPVSKIDNGVYAILAPLLQQGIAHLLTIPDFY